MHLLTAKDEMLQEAMIFINRSYDSQMAMPMCNCYMPTKHTTKEKKKWNNKKTQNRARKMNMQRRDNPSDYDMQFSGVHNGYGYEYHVMRHTLTPTLKFKTCIIHMVNYEVSNTRTKLMTAQELKDQAPEELRQYPIMQPTYNTASTPAKIEFNTLQSEAIMEQERIDEFYRRANMQTIKMDIARIYSKKTGHETIHVYAQAYMDSASDTCGMGGEAWIIDYVTERKVQVVGYHKKDTAMNHIKIGGGITAVDLPNKTTVLIRVCEATLLGKDANTLFSVAQMRDHGVFIDDVP